MRGWRATRHFRSVSIALNLPSDLREFVDEAVKSGRFSDEEELICEALENLRTQEDFLKFRRASLQEKLRAGVADIEAGRVAEWDSEAMMQKGRALLAARLAGN